MDWLALALLVVAVLFGLALGWAVTYLWMRRPELPASAIDPKPAAATSHRHEWDEKSPYLHDPTPLPRAPEGRWLYKCQRCTAVLRSNKRLKAES